MIYLKIFILVVAIVGVFVFLHYLLFTIQKFIRKKISKLFWVIPGVFNIVGASLIMLYGIGSFYHFGCGKNIYILYFGLGFLAIIALPNYIVSKKIYE